MKLDFSEFPDITQGCMFWRLPDDSLKAEPEVWDRAVAALFMLFKMHGEPAQDGVTKQINAEVHLRSALVEFVGIEELLQKKGYKFKITDLSNPLFHIMRLLRNLQVHFSELNVKDIKVDILFADEEYTVNGLIINNINTEGLCELRAVKKYKTYTVEQIDLMTKAFNEQQNRLGVYDLLRVGINLYLKEVSKLITSS